MRYLLIAGQEPPLFVHSRCEDELLAKAELLLFAQDAAETYPGRTVVGSYDVEPGISIGELKRAYRHEPESYARLLEHRRQILAQGWTYLEWAPDSG